MLADICDRIPGASDISLGTIIINEAGIINHSAARMIAYHSECAVMDQGALQILKRGAAQRIGDDNAADRHRIRADRNQATFSRLSALSARNSRGEREAAQQFVPQQTLNTEWSSMPLGATPVCPCSTSKKPTPVSEMTSLAVWNEVVTAYFASNALREVFTCVFHELPVSQPG